MGETHSGGPPAIAISSLTKRYGDKFALDGISLMIAPGEVAAVLGPNGAGKTTLIELLLGMRTPTAGTIEVFGASPSSRAVKSRVGAMLQDTGAPDGLTVREIVTLVSSYYPVGIPVAEALERAGLTEHLRKKTNELSGGLRQRLSFAMAVVGDPDLMYLDEPTASLDVAARREFWTQVQGFAGLGKTILFSTHNLSEADEFAQRLILLDSGRVIQDSTPEAAKRLVAGRRVALTTDAPLDVLSTTAGVIHAEFDGGDPPPTSALPGKARAAVVRCNSPEALLRRLFTEGWSVADLTVTEATLEDAFLHLTDRTTKPQPSDGGTP
ncbi:ABC transporter ATP-binding protein [Sinomonas sp. ASV486]|uniref:ABC transporter ATP-binding protein n=1 Tax=Sinomonas sp. ASV486 TaxID=3051170 RepID=UPI0027DC7A92|nr:ABC transporter ATP-binding protein [Sinomonas sp. ASV486]MDQ4489900.1 ABC transporter ATP-binding protein [Sinomonas sp. ASV486]